MDKEYNIASPLLYYSDIIFLLGTEAIYRLSILLLSTFKNNLLQCQTFESIMEFLKVDLTQMDTSKMEEVFNQIISLDISKQLTVYEIEYNVIQEEMQFSANVSIFEE